MYQTALWNQIVYHVIISFVYSQHDIQSERLLYRCALFMLSILNMSFYCLPVFLELCSFLDTIRIPVPMISHLFIESPSLKCSNR